MKQINLHLIRTDGGTQSRVSLNQFVVEEYAEHMKNGDVFPPITVFHDGSDYWLADGFHRLFAFKSIGKSLIDVDVKQGTVGDAEEYSLGANKGTKRGLSNSQEDIRSIITRMLTAERYKDWSSRRIAEHVGVSDMTVGRIKKTLDIPAADQDTVKFTRNGKEHEMKVKGLVERKPVEPKPVERPVGTKPDSSTVNEDKLEIAMLNDRVSELADTINELASENDLLKDKIAIGQWDATEIEKIDIEDTIKDLRENIRILKIENSSLREGRDMYQNKTAELMRVNKSLQAKLKKYES